MDFSFYCRSKFQSVCFKICASKLSLVLDYLKLHSIIMFSLLNITMKKLQLNILNVILLKQIFEVWDLFIVYTIISIERFIMI